MVEPKSNWSTKAVPKPCEREEDMRSQNSEYPTAGMVNWRIPLELKGVAEDKAINNHSTLGQVLKKR
jgi:hypothetical protein